MGISGRYLGFHNVTSAFKVPKRNFNLWFEHLQFPDYFESFEIAVSALTSYYIFN
jgi:hypothetical protein